MAFRATALLLCLLIAGPLSAADTDKQLRFFTAPKKRAQSAVNESWPRFLGPNDNATTGETNLLGKFPEGGLARVWSLEKGTGYTSPVIGEGKLVLFDRLGDEEVTLCLHPETGQTVWEHRYPVEYEDRYGFLNGPRASAVISEGQVFTLGVRSVVHAYELETGKVLWRYDIEKEVDNIAPYFFGHGSCPLVFEDLLIIPVGSNETSRGSAVIALDQNTGQRVWTTEHEWNASYASPIVAPFDDRPTLLSFSGGESRPSHGGLLAIEPKSGELLAEFPWRSEKYESVNGQTPIALPGNRVFISDTYEKGGVMLRFDRDTGLKPLWKDPHFGMHWMTPVFLKQENLLLGFRGRNEPDATLVAYDVDTGKKLWEDDSDWEIDIGTPRPYRMKFLRGSALAADGKVFLLGELGSLAVAEVGRDGLTILAREQLFLARSTWSLPVISQGLLYVSQHEPDAITGAAPALHCYDLRAGE